MEVLRKKLGWGLVGWICFWGGLSGAQASDRINLPPSFQVQQAPPSKPIDFQAPTLMENSLEAKPKVLEVIPKAGSSDISPFTGIIIKFATPMDPQKIQEMVTICEGLSIKCSDEPVLYRVTNFLGLSNEYELTPYISFAPDYMPPLSDDVFYTVKIKDAECHNPENINAPCVYFFKTKEVPTKVMEHFPKKDLNWSKIGPDKWFQITLNFNKLMNTETFTWNNVKVFATSESFNGELKPGPYSALQAGGNLSGKEGMTELSIRLDSVLKDFVDKPAFFTVIVTGMKDIRGHVMEPLVFSFHMFP